MHMILFWRPRLKHPFDAAATVPRTVILVFLPPAFGKESAFRRERPPCQLGYTGAEFGVGGAVGLTFLFACAAAGGLLLLLRFLFRFIGHCVYSFNSHSSASASGPPLSPPISITFASLRMITRA